MSLELRLKFRERERKREREFFEKFRSINEDKKDRIEIKKRKLKKRDVFVFIVAVSRPIYRKI